MFSQCGYPMSYCFHVVAHILSGLSACCSASVPTSGRPPSLLTGSCRFSVRRLSIGTMGALRLPPFHPHELGLTLPCVPELASLFSHFHCVSARRSRTEGVGSRSRPNPGFVLWRTTGLPCFMVSLLMVCPALRPRLCLGTSLYRSSDFVPVNSTTKTNR